VGDPSHPFGGRLEELSLTFRFDHHVVLGAVDKLKSALTTNRRLHTLQMRFLYCDPTGIVNALRSSCEPVVCTVAFLAAVHANNCTSLSELNSDMLRVILEFAAHSRQRAIHISGDQGAIAW
jgi:hypothetical protein